MMEMTTDTHEQDMACLECGLAGLTPPDHFPQEPGVWDRPCPRCGGTVWVGEPRKRDACIAELRGEGR